METATKTKDAPLAKRRIGFELKALNNMIRRKMAAEFAQQNGAELAGMQGPMLGFLYHRGMEQDVFQRDLEKEFYIRRSTATVMLQNLEQKGYLVRVPSKEDARLKKIVLTEKAIAHQKLIEKSIDAFNDELEAGLTREEKEAFLHIVDKLRKNLES